MSGGSGAFGAGRRMIGVWAELLAGKRRRREARRPSVSATSGKPIGVIALTQEEEEEARISHE